MDGERLNPLSVDDLQYFETRFFLVPGTGTVYVDAKLSVIRRRAVGDGFHEELTILNHDADPVDLKVRVEAASDFADLFEVKDALEKKGRYHSRVDDGNLVPGYQRGVRRQTTDFGDGAGQARQARLDLRCPHRAGTRGRRISMSSPRSGRAVGTSGRSTSGASDELGRTWSGASSAGFRIAQPESDSDSSRRHTTEALIDLAALRSRCPSPADGARQPPAFRGS